MNLSISRAAFVRTVPFVLFLLLLAVRGALPPDDRGGVLDGRWVYAASLLLVGGLMLFWRHEYGELSRQNLPLPREVGLAVAVGLAVFGLWIVLDAPWMVLSEPTAPFRPVRADGTLDWPLVVVRWLGATLLVPVMEELFWRSLLMRWLDGQPFTAVDPTRVGLRAVVLSTFVFVLAHTLWLAAAVAGLAYALLYRRTGRLWVPVIAHAVTNGVLGVWVVATGRWAFW